MMPELADGNATRDAYELLGEMNELAYRLAMLAADIDDDRFSRLVHDLRASVMVTGDECCRLGGGGDLERSLRRVVSRLSRNGKAG